MTEPIISINDLSVYFNKKKALNNVTMDFYPNEITALIGPSGSGKSTLLRSINRMGDLNPEWTLTGAVSYNGHNVYSPRTDTVELRKEIGMVFQQPNPFPMSIYENVVYGLRINGIKDKAVLDKAVEESLKGASIWEEVKDRLHDSALGLSGGQQQRVCIARVLATSPKVILLDEPTSALDPISAGKIEETLYNLKDQYTLLLVTRSMQQASRISQRTAFFLDGELIEYSSTKDIHNIKKQKIILPVNSVKKGQITKKIMMLRTPFEEELEKLHNQFYAMGTEVAAQLKKAVRAFISHDRDLAKEVIENDEIVNNYETKLEKKSLEIIALQQPVSSDLRTVITALKASSDVERMGDHAVAIAQATIRIKGEERLTEIEAEIKKMGKAVRHMVEDALDVYLNSDEQRAYEIAASDEIIDNYFRDIQAMTVEGVRKNPDAAFAAKEYFQVLMYLERIGDYARNLCEWVVYLKSGKIIEL